MDRLLHRQSPITGALQTEGLGGEKYSTGKIDSQGIWNCGDTECSSDWTICGFSMGPAFYGTSVLTVDTTNIAEVQNNDFLTAWTRGPRPHVPTDSLRQGHLKRGGDQPHAWSSIYMADLARRIGRQYREPQEHSRQHHARSDEADRDAGGAAAHWPHATALGLLATLRDGAYLYTYPIGDWGLSNIVICRVAADDLVFDAAQYECLAQGPEADWVTGILAGEHDEYWSYDG
jgi:hypothetical protein